MTISNFQSQVAEKNRAFNLKLEIANCHLSIPSPASGAREDTQEAHMDRLTTKRRSEGPWALIGLFLPGILFALGLITIRDQPRYRWLASVAEFPWELWTIAVCGLLATAGGIFDWRFHRSGRTAVGRAERHSEALALLGGGVPLFAMMAAASIVARPQALLLPILVVVLATTTVIAYDEFVYHRKRCGVYETFLHRLLVFGNGLAWLAWMHWCFVREVSA
jgi:hypothetical protein